ncbi:MAG: hypothetical protein IT462_13435 [Planctomycetes bacterium]|nr:hypothetical protein [Planctomycetota bacterium]
MRPVLPKLLLFVAATFAAPCLLADVPRNNFGEMDKYEWFTVRTRDDIERLPQRAVAVKLDAFAPEEAFAALCEVTRIEALQVHMPKSAEERAKISKLKNLKLLHTPLHYYCADIGPLLPNVEILIHPCSANGTREGCWKMGSDGIENAAKFTNLRVFVFGGNGVVEELGVKPDAIAKLWKLKTLRKLDISYCMFEEGSVKGLANLTNLEELDIYSCYGLNEEDAKAVTTLPNLKHLRLGTFQQLLPVLANLNRVTSLEALVIEGAQSNYNSAPLTGDDLRPLIGLLRLRRLEIGDIGLESVERAKDPRAVLRQLIGLEFLRIEYPGMFDSEVNPECWRWLAPLQNLRRLRLGQAVSDVALEVIATLPRLASLDISGDFSAGLGLLAESSSKLETIALGGNVSDVALGFLARIKTLKEIRISSGSLSGRGFSRFGEHSALAAVTLQHCGVDAAGLAQLAAVPNLKSVSIYGCRFAEMQSINDLVEVLAAAKGLERVAIGPPEGVDAAYAGLFKVSARGMKALVSLTQLRELDVSTIENLGEDVPGVLAKLPKLEKLTLRGIEPESARQVLLAFRDHATLRHVHIPLPYAGEEHKHIDALRRANRNLSVNVDD